MMSKSYSDVIDKIQASEQFKNDTIRMIKRQSNNRRDMFMMKKGLIGLAACLVLMVGIKGYQGSTNPNNVIDINMDLTERIVVDPNAPNGDAIVNIEGVIVEVADDGLSFKLDNGKWIFVNDDTIIGITSPNAAAKEEQFFEPTFRVGNNIAGFAIDPDGKEVDAYVIYTNWNWEDPIK